MTDQMIPASPPGRLTPTTDPAMTDPITTDPQVKDSQAKERGPNGLLGAAARTLHPGYFALVMATGIVSSALLDSGREAMSMALLVIAVICFVVLVTLLTIRVVRFRDELIVDLSAPDRAYSFFTFVAACGVLGSRLTAAGIPMAAVVFGGIGMVVWVGLSYGLPVRLVLGTRAEPVLAGVNGTWFIWVVGTQSLAIIAAVLGSAYPAQMTPAGLTAVLMWSVGVVLYLIVATLMLTRLLLLEVRPQDLTPPYWITRGATAITVFAAARILRMPDAPAVVATRPVVSGAAVMLWAFGTWLIPMLVAFGVWRHVLHRVQVEYMPQLWSIVFPLGMYSVASMELGQRVHLPIMRGLGHAWVWVAVTAWVLTFGGMIYSLVQALVRRRRTASAASASSAASPSQQTAD